MPKILLKCLLLENRLNYCAILSYHHAKIVYLFERNFSFQVILEFIFVIDVRMCVCVLVRNLNLLRPIANYERLINIIFGFSLNRLKRQARYLIERDPFRCESFKGLNYNTFKVYL